MTIKVNKIKIEKEFRVCPNCRYEDGFHSMFERIEDGKEFSWKLICPNCHKVFDIDLGTQIES